MRIVIPFTPGGGADTIARLVAIKMTEVLGNQFYVESKPGAGGNIASEFVARSPADGYTMFLAGDHHATNNHLYWAGVEAAAAGIAADDRKLFDWAVAAFRTGLSAEARAAAYLMAKGYRILGHRLRTPYGEVDVAAWKAGVLVIIEVKARTAYDAGVFAVTPTAQQRIGRAAKVLAGRWRLMSAPIRFDLVVVGSGLLPRHERGAWFDDRVGA